MCFRSSEILKYVLEGSYYLIFKEFEFPLRYMKRCIMWVMIMPPSHMFENPNKATGTACIHLDTIVCYCSICCARELRRVSLSRCIGWWVWMSRCVCLYSRYYLHHFAKVTLFPRGINTLQNCHPNFKRVNHNPAFHLCLGTYLQP